MEWTKGADREARCLLPPRETLLFIRSSFAARVNKAAREPLPPLCHTSVSPPSSPKRTTQAHHAAGQQKPPHHRWTVRTRIRACSRVGAAVIPRAPNTPAPLFCANSLVGLVRGAWAAERGCGTGTARELICSSSNFSTSRLLTSYEFLKTSHHVSEFSGLPSLGE